jgi:hypothetical protein
MPTAYCIVFHFFDSCDRIWCKNKLNRETDGTVVWGSERSWMVLHLFVVKKDEKIKWEELHRIGSFLVKNDFLLHVNYIESFDMDSLRFVPVSAHCGSFNYHGAVLFNPCKKAFPDLLTLHSSLAPACKFSSILDLQLDRLRTKDVYPVISFNQPKRTDYTYGQSHRISW